MLLRAVIIHLNNVGFTGSILKDIYIFIPHKYVYLL